MTLATLLIAATLLTGQPDPKAATGSVDLSAQVRKLVRQLDDDELAVRDAAEGSLVELGVPALDLLPPDSPRMSDEMKTRLARVRETLLTAAVEAATRASKVTIKADAMPLSAVLAEIEKQTGNRLVDKRADFGQKADDTPITAKFEETPFWTALDTVLDQAKLTIYGFSEEANIIALIAGHPEQVSRKAFTGYGEVFRVEATRLEAIRDLRTTANEGLNLTLNIAWEPRLTPLALSQPLDALQGVTEDGDKLSPAGRGGSLQPAVYPGMTSTEMIVPLALPPRSAEKLTSVSGQLEVLVPGRIEDFTFDNLVAAKNVTVRKGAATVVLQTTRKNGDVYEIFMVLQFDKAANALESHRDWVSGNQAFLVDKMGDKVEHAGFETTRQTVNEYGAAWRFVLEQPLSEYRFTYRTPAAIVKKTIDYQIEDLPLP